MALETLPDSPITTNGEFPMQKNDAKGGWIIQKFGGTSVGKFADKIAEDIVRFELHSHHSVETFKLFFY